jgi:uncharacterized paraquat-inducible protein A
MNSWRYKLISFMSGRYGNDRLNYTLFFVYLLVWLINLFVFSSIVSLILDLAQLSLMLTVLFRMFSRNIYKRQKENQLFLKLFGKYLPDTQLLKNKYIDRHTHVYKKCKNCKSVLRLKKIKGEHTAICPKCSNRIKVKIR